jgi:hypothetical protein
MLLLTLKRQDFVLFFKNCAKYALGPELEPEPKLFQSRNWNCNKSLQFHNILFLINVIKNVKGSLLIINPLSCTVAHRTT